MFFEYWWWKFFRALEAWICKNSLIYNLLVFLEAFKLDFIEIWDLRRLFGWFLFECSSYSKVEVFEVLKDFKSLIPAELISFWMYPRLLNAYRYLKWLGKTSIYRSLEKLSDMWTNLIGDKCHNLSRENLRLSSKTHSTIWLAEMS